MKVLLVGAGGREQAIAWKVRQSPQLTQLFTSNETDVPTLVNIAREKKVDLVIIGGETLLAAGLSDALKEAGIKAFGPSKTAAQIEASKVFAKDFMQRHDIPTARYAIFTDFEAALQHVKTIGYSVVIKASGLAAGKGVFLPHSLMEAETILRQLLLDHALGNASNEIIIEELLQGEEVSLLAFTDGKTVKVMPPARDHKRLYEGNEGPNTGGMGAYAPVALPYFEMVTVLSKDILHRAVDGLRIEDRPFIGVLYAGLMLTPAGPKVLEFNCRFGDPETQALLPLLDSDLLEIMNACVTGQLNQCAIRWKAEAAICVVLAAKGYPQQSQKDDVISGLKEEDDNTVIFHAGTRQVENNWLTSGGRVLNVVAWGRDLPQARKRAYQRVNKINFTGMQYRQDIGEETYD